MLTLECDAATVARARWAVSPMMEAVSWLRWVGTNRPHPIFGDPGAAARSLLGHRDIALLSRLLPGDGLGYMPDLLTPQPGAGQDGPETQLALIEATPAEAVETQLVANMTSHWGAPAAGDILRTAENGTLTRRLTNGLAVFWRHVFHDVWSSLRPILERDLDERMRFAGRTGLGPALAHLHPALGWTGRAITLAGSCSRTGQVHDREIVLCAGALSWPRLLVQVDDPGQLVLHYPARRIGAAVAPTPTTPTSPTSPESAALAGSLGRVRTALLSDLDRPRSTTELAARHEYAPSTVSYHLTALRQANLVTGRREGRHVRYHRTTTADLLLDSP